MSGYWREGATETWQEKCPGCGKFVSPDAGWCAWAEPADSFMSLYCGEKCHTMHRARTGLTDAAFPQYAE